MADTFELTMSAISDAYRRKDVDTMMRLIIVYHNLRSSRDLVPIIYDRQDWSLRQHMLPDHAVETSYFPGIPFPSWKPLLTYLESKAEALNGGETTTVGSGPKLPGSFEESKHELFEYAAASALSFKWLSDHFQPQPVADDRIEELTEQLRHFEEDQADLRLLVTNFREHEKSNGPGRTEPPTGEPGPSLSPAPDPQQERPGGSKRRPAPKPLINVKFDRASLTADPFLRGVIRLTQVWFVLTFVASSLNTFAHAHLPIGALEGYMFGVSALIAMATETKRHATMPRSV